MEAQDDEVTAYVRHRLRLLMDSGMEQQEIARRTGLSKGLISAHRARSGVGAKAARAYAKLFGLADVGELRREARAWQDGPAAEVPAVELEAAEAIEMIVGLGQATRAQVLTILAAYTHPRFRGRDTAWWTSQLLPEVARDRSSSPAPPRPPDAAANVAPQPDPAHALPRPRKVSR